MSSLLLLTACTRSAVSTDAPQIETTRIYITTTPKLTPTASPTPTLTPSPTPTAPAISVVGNPRGYTLFDPLPQSGAVCGWADTLDFPLEPPNGESASGGSDFGVYRNRYEKNHAGEDWRMADRNNFGKPVYSIGHGEVTYAQPLGWGADKGVVIIRHTFPDGTKILSFYGHLDPPSVTLQPGRCIRRGDIVGQIGRPRTSPHLHFEVRVHLPYSTGGGYWPGDPTEAGWLPPSQTLSQYRMQVSPGAVWTDTKVSDTSMPLGLLNDTLFLAIEDHSLVGINLLTGDEIWSYELVDFVKAALFDPNRRVLYISDVGSGLIAYALPQEDEPFPDELEILWVHSLPASGQVDLMPLPGGGLLIGHKGALSAFSAQGDLLWEADEESSATSWALAGDTLIFATLDRETPLMTADSVGLSVWENSVGGVPLAAGNQSWLYTHDSLYQLDIPENKLTRVYVLPTAWMQQSAALPMPDGGLILVHTDAADRRLLSFDASGNLQCEFSVPLSGAVTLLEQDGSIYLVSHPLISAHGSYKTVEVFAVDFEGENLFRIFEGGTRAFNPGTTWAVSLGSQGILINIGGGGRILLDPQAALKRMSNE